MLPSALSFPARSRNVAAGQVGHQPPATNVPGKDHAEQAQIMASLAQEEQSLSGTTFGAGQCGVVFQEWLRSQVDLVVFIDDEASGGVMQLLLEKPFVRIWRAAILPVVLGPSTGERYCSSGHRRWPVPNAHADARFQSSRRSDS